MLNNFLSYTDSGQMTAGSFFICFGAAIVFGILVALMHMYHNHYTKNFILTLILMPAVLTILFNVSSFGNPPDQIKHLKVTIPENLDYTEI